MSEEKKRLIERIKKVKALQEAMKKPIPPPVEEEKKETSE